MRTAAMGGERMETFGFAIAVAAGLGLLAYRLWILLRSDG